MPPAPPALSAAVVPLPHPAVSLKEPGLTSKGFTALSIFTTKSIMKKFPQHQKLLEKYLLGIVKKRIEGFFVTYLLKDFYSQ